MIAERITYYEIRIFFICSIYQMSLVKIDSLNRGRAEPYSYAIGCASEDYEGVYDLPVEQLMLGLIELLIYLNHNLEKGTQYCRDKINQILSMHNLDKLLSDVPDEEKNTFLSDLNLLEITNNADILQTLATSDFKHHSGTVENDGSLYTEIIHDFSEYIYAGCLEKIKLSKQDPEVELPINYSTHYALENCKSTYTRPVECLMLAIVKLVFAVDTELDSAIPQIQDEINQLLSMYQLDELMTELIEDDRVDLSHHIKILSDASLIKA